MSEAVERVKCFIECFGRDPKPHELREEFIYYVNQTNVQKYEQLGVPIRKQLAEAYNVWISNHKTSKFENFEEFINYCKNN